MHNQSFTWSGDTTPPYTNVSRAPLLIGMTAGFLGLTLVFVVLRIYVRAIILKKWGLDDALLVVSYMTIAATLGYHITFIVVKMAILFQYRRVFALPQFCLYCDLMLGFIGIFGIAVVVSSIVISAPTWRGDTFEFERYNQTAWWLATATVHLATDFIIFFMPMPMLSKLKLEKVQKCALIATFGVGFV
ncbi:integral membrane protein [Colletotrichum tofieldiae]|nr:integral membrane protein [Colletotrichum tofieldiae]GKT71789.1 integral membrane protein [Colletotrichum tofieldiae]